MGMKKGFLCGILFGFIALRVVTADDATNKECSEYLQKTMACLDFARGKITTPSKECCSAVKGIKDDDPKCLCYIIKEANGGEGDMVKNLGVQVPKLLQLPSACQLKNASTSLCPKLLGLSPSSPDAAIFTNTSSSATPTTPAAAGTSASDGSSGNMHGPYLLGPTVIIAMSIFFYAFPTGSASLCA
ncbi:non-specific lipid transfer protein GPI-anchored 1 [Citrus sinensis]|nr:non-specific lipid transfer protein GPI-anchored 1 [Citrus sinensis]